MLAEAQKFYPDGAPCCLSVPWLDGGGGSNDGDGGWCVGGCVDRWWGLPGGGMNCADSDVGAQDASTLLLSVHALCHCET